jgi:nucleotidyltransferase/DNA polymerase involved in DNA repair
VRRALTRVRRARACAAAQTLRHLVLLHGGGYEQYPSDRVTHVIASTCAAGKAEAVRNKLRPRPPWVTGAWLVDSIAACRVLPVASYLLADVALVGGQQQLSFGAPAAPTLLPSPPRAAAPFALAPARALLAPQPQPQPQPQPPQPPQPQQPQPQLQAPPPARAAGAAGAHAEAHELARDARAACPLLARAAPRASNEDPDFIRNYFAASRLHFIGSFHDTTTKLLLGELAALPRPQPAEPGPGRERLIFHVDMDCFFASVVARDEPRLRGVPLAVSHSESTSGTGEVSSASYEARAYGVRAGQRICDAKQACPNLVVMPYDFARFAAVSNDMYRALAPFSARLQPLSCDEAALDVTGLAGEDPEALALRVRAAVRAATRGCEASVGIGPNKLLAKLATRCAKPAGQFRITAASAAAFLAPLPVRDLHGVGRSTAEQLAALGIATAGDLARAELRTLQATFGDVCGANLAAVARGEDNSAVELLADPKSLGAECNWGVRCTSRAEADALLDGLAAYVAERLREAGRAGRKLTFHVLRSKGTTAEPYKFLGHGECHSFSHALQLNCATQDAAQLAAEAKRALTRFAIPPTSLRGVGIHMGDLVPASAACGAHVGIQPSVADVLARAAAAAAGAAGGEGGGEGRAASPPARDAYEGITLSQVDPAWLAGLDKQSRDETQQALRLRGKRGSPSAPPPPPPPQQQRSPVAAALPQALPAREEVDMDVFALLPPELQQEHLVAWAAADRRREAAAAAPVPASLRAGGGGGGGAGRGRAPARRVPAGRGRGAIRKRKAKATPAARTRPVPPRAPPPPLPPRAIAAEPLCAPMAVKAVQEALQLCVLKAAVLPEAEREDAFDAAAAVLQAHCEACVAAADLPSVRQLLRFARRLTTLNAAPIWNWAPHCERAVAGAQAAVAVRYQTRLALDDPGAAALSRGGDGGKGG